MSQLTLEFFNLIKTIEGKCLTAYRCSADVATIGYGHTGLVRDSPLVVNETIISEEEAEQLLIQDLVVFKKIVGDAIQS